MTGAATLEVVSAGSFFVEMLEDVAAYLILAPLAASVALGAAVAVWLAGPRRAPARVLARIRLRRPRR